MLVEINLLPKKEPKRIGFIVALTVLVCGLIFAAAFYYWQIQLTKNSIETTNKQIVMTQKLAAKIKKDRNIAESSKSVNQLKQAIAWADDHRLETIPVMRHLTSLLPERGFIQSFAYQQSRTVTLAVQFDTEREAAYYLHRLNESDWITDVSLNALSTVSNSPVATNNGSSTGTAPDSNSSTETNSQYLPRYTGQFTITFNQAAIKRAEKGVSGS